MSEIVFQNEFLSKDALDNLVNDSFFFHTYTEANHTSLGKDIARMTFYASSQIFSGLYLGMATKFSSDKYLQTRDIAKESGKILNGLYFIDLKLEEMWNDYKHKTDLEKHLSNFSWFDGTNVCLGEKLAQEDNLLLGYILDTAGKDYLIQSNNDSGKGYFKLAGQGRKVADSIGIISKNIKRLEAFIDNSV